MMRLLVLSDLHVEYAHFGAMTAPDAFDVVILAGDIGQASLAVRWARETFPDHPIVQIAGNHEYFNTVRESALQAMRVTARELDICFLEQSSAVVGEVEFLGCTLWTDYRLYERAGRPRAMSAQDAMASAHRTMLDYRRIECLQGDGSISARPFTPGDSIALHSQARTWLESALAAPRQCVGGGRRASSTSAPSAGLRPAYPAYPPSPVILASSLTAGSGDGGGGTGALHMANPLNSGPTAASAARRGSTAGLAPGAVAALPRSDTAVLMQIALAMQVGGAQRGRLRQRARCL
jgi:hypothetical protein